MLEIWKIYGILSAIFASLVAITAKIGLEKVDTTIATTIRSIVMAIFLITLSLYLSKYKELSGINSKNLLFIIISGICGALSWIFYFMAIDKASTDNTSAVVALDRLSLIFVYIFSVIFFSTQITFSSVFAIFLITIGTIILSI